LSCGDRRFEGVHILQLPAEQLIEEKQVEIFRMEVQVEVIQFAAQLDFCSKGRELADDVVEIARTVHLSPIFDFIELLRIICV